MSASSRKDLLKVLLSTNALADPGEGPGGPGARGPGGPAPLFFTKLAEKNFLETAPPPPRLSKDLDDRAPSLSQGLELVTGTGHTLTMLTQGK